jgi:hypothetical protein
MANGALLPVSIAHITGVVYWSDQNGNVYKEDPTTGTDNGTWYDGSAETMWISSSGPVGFQRVRRVQVNAESVDPHDLIVSLAFDYAPTYAQSFRWTAAQIQAMGHESVQLRVGAQNGANPRCRAIKVKVQMVAPTGGPVAVSGIAGQLSGLGLEIIPKPGMPRFGAKNASD